MTSLPTRMESNSVKTFIPRIISLRFLPYCAPPTEKTAPHHVQLSGDEFTLAGPITIQVVGVALSPECSKVSELSVRVYSVCFWGGRRGHRDI